MLEALSIGQLLMRRPSTVFIAVAVLLGVVIGLGIYTFLYAKGYSYLTNNPEACANCHVMQAQYEGWLKSSHHSAATCNDCHTPHNIIGKYAVKADNGFWHSFYFTSGRYPDTAEDPQTILAYEMNGQPLPIVHGAPLRLRVETQLGFTKVKYIRAIEFIEDYETIGQGQGGWREDYQYFSQEAGI
jgi:hypothetical protein